MQLFRCKVAGHFILQNSDWFTIHEKMTTITAPTGSGKSTLLKALRSINPLFCHPDPAPFAAFPHSAGHGRHIRKVIPAKKTAVIAVFICDNALRHTLTAIDPIFINTDRIEVGRRLDNSRWLTYVEISGSSRWSNLAPELEKLRRKFPASTGDHRLAGMWQKCEMLAPTDRIKGALATELNELLDYLAIRARDEDDHALLQQARFIVNRASRFMKARQATTETLPVFLYLQQDNLLSTAIDVGLVAEKMRQTAESPWRCADLFLLELLGIDQNFLQQDGDEIALRLRKNALLYESAGCRLGERLRKYLPGSVRGLSLTLAGGVLSLRMDCGPEKNGCPAEISDHWRWMLSCAVSACYLSEVPGRQPIFLLDEPDAAPSSRDDKIELEEMLRRLSDSCQVLVCTTKEDFAADSGRRYRLHREGENGFRVFKNL